MTISGYGQQETALVWGMLRGAPENLGTSRTTRCGFGGTVTAGSRRAGGGGGGRNQAGGKTWWRLHTGSRAQTAGPPGTGCLLPHPAPHGARAFRGDPGWLPPRTPTALLARQRVDRQGHRVSQYEKATLMVIICNFRLFLSWERKTSTKKSLRIYFNIS